MAVDSEHRAAAQAHHAVAVDFQYDFVPTKLFLLLFTLLNTCSKQTYTTIKSNTESSKKADKLPAFQISRLERNDIEHTLV